MYVCDTRVCALSNSLTSRPFTIISAMWLNLNYRVYMAVSICVVRICARQREWYQIKIKNTHNNTRIESMLYVRIHWKRQKSSKINDDNNNHHDDTTHRKWWKKRKKNRMKWMKKWEKNQMREKKKIRRRGKNPKQTLKKYIGGQFIAAYVHTISFELDDRSEKASKNL